MKDNGTALQQIEKKQQYNETLKDKQYEGPKGRPERGEWEPIKNSCNRKDRLSPEVHAQP